MKRWCLFGLMSLAGCATSQDSAPGAPPAPPGITFAGGDGLSCAGRVLIHGATGERDGIAAEHAWLKGKYPGYRVKGQSLSACDKNMTDVLAIATTDGQERQIYFDISDFFGKGF